MKNKIKYIIVWLVILLFHSLYSLGCSSKANASTNRSKSAVIFVRIKDAVPTDSLSLYYWTDMVNETRRYLTAYHKIDGVKYANGTFRFEIPNIKNFVYFDISKGATELGLMSFLETYIAEAGDSVFLSIIRNMEKYHEADNKYDQTKFLTYLHASSTDSLYKVEFSGKGSAKYNIRFTMDKISYFNFTNHKYSFLLDSTVNYNKDNYSDFVLETCFTLLDNRKKELSPLVYNLLKTDIFSKIQLEKMNEVSMRIDFKYNGDFNKVKKAHDIVNSVPDLSIPDAVKAKSKNYVTYLSRKELFQFDHWNDRYKAYWFLKNKNDGILKERVIAGYLVGSYLYIKGAETLLKDAYLTISYPSYKHEILKIQARQTGNLAYDFKLPNASGKLIQLSEFRGKWVFVDFWYTGCSNCASYYEYHLSKVEKEFNDSVVFITVSIDKDKKKWMESVNSGKYTSSHAINLYTDGMGYNHDVIKQNNVIGYPQPFLIDPKGKIYRTDLELRDGNKLREIINVALKMKY